jgi:hypothetical protein
MIHIDRGGDWKPTHHFFDQLELSGVRYDVIGQPYHLCELRSLDDLVTGAGASIRHVGTRV